MKVLKNIYEFLRFLLLFMWSYSPVLAITDDNHFGTIECRGRIRDSVKKMRISLLNLMLGSKTIYIFSYKIYDNKFEIFVINALEKLDSFVLSDDDISKISNRYREHLLLLSAANDDIAEEKESLIYRIETEERRIEKSGDKINLYTTIILTVIPLVAAFGDLKKYYTFSNISKIMSFAIVYCLLNIILYVFQSVKIQGVVKSKFSDLRSSDNHKIQLNIQYHRDWQYLKRKADLFVSYVKNLQTWVIYIFVLIIALAIYVSINSNNINISVHQSESSKVINLCVDELNNPYSSSSIELTELKLDIQQHTVSSVYILSLNKNVSEKLIIDIKDTYKDLTVKYLTDKSLDMKTIKIITEE